MDSADAALDRLCDPETEVSAHYLICEAGRIYQLVEEDLRAWHAGAGSWAGAGDVNSRSIGIELANTGAAPFPEPQMRALEALLPGIMDRWSIPPQGVIGHSDMAPARKQDPGRRFDWRRLARLGLAVWPEGIAAAGAPPDAARFREALVRFGYPDAEPHETLLDAMRQRFRPWASGPLSDGDMAVAQALAAAFGIDRDGGSA